MEDSRRLLVLIVDDDQSMVSTPRDIFMATGLEAIPRLRQEVERRRRNR